MCVRSGPGNQRKYYLADSAQTGWFYSGIATVDWAFCWSYRTLHIQTTGEDRARALK